MNNKLKATLVTLGILATFASTAFAWSIDYNGTLTYDETDSTLGNHVVGIAKNFGGSNTYGYSWVDPSDNQKRCYTRIKMGSWYPKTYGIGYAQSAQEVRPYNWTVFEDHGV